MKETESESDGPHELLVFSGYDLVVQKNQLKVRTTNYNKNWMKYKRRSELEGTNGHVIVLDLIGTKPYRLKILYRTFKPPAEYSIAEFLNIKLN